MGLIEKIEEIRKKPDHIKLRYVWFLVAVCMVFVVAIWILSLKADMNEMSQQNKTTNQETSDVKQSGADLLKEIGKQKDAMQSAKSDMASDQTNN